MTQNLQNLDLPWKVKLSIYAICFGCDLSRRSNGSINRFLTNFYDFKSFPSNKPFNGVTSIDLTIDKARNLWFRLYTPTPGKNATMPVVFYFHGGGFGFMAPHSRPYNNLCYQLAGELSAIIISVNYRLAPEHRCPAQYQDCFDALKFIDETNLEDFPSHADLEHCFLAGDSAGGNIVHHVMFNASKHEFRRIKLAGAMLVQPFFGGEERTEAEIMLDGKVPFVNIERSDWMWRAFLPEGSDRNHPAANVFGPNADDISRVKFPASVVFIAGFDPLKDWQRRYYEGLKKHGKEAYLIEYPNTFHSFYGCPELPVFSLFIKDMQDFMQKQLASPKL